MPYKLLSSYECLIKSGQSLGSNSKQHSFEENLCLDAEKGDERKNNLWLFVL